jgi:hypothetical protein
VLPPSADYELQISARHGPGSEVARKVSHEIASGTTDRFAVRLVPPGGDLRLYRLEVLLYHDTATRPMRLGEALLSLPEVRIRGYLRDKAARSCARANESRLRGVAAPHVVTPSRLANLLAGD